ncbi:MAG TPA: ParB/RepB/Spo0J family partition protein [Streptomyces sp.]|uniref:ParB/RepB/Spo0J family partition protein n=1 Tax=Streptomyces sp. TaxID=1931 RepID=UPI002C4077DF|nr:ParB/RepB/Spo0J family partition protein [Streptomyces sp.]HWU10544.1 ParB/RepB/Spo0J family partition protein [Streptomyces sp.]
MSENQRQRVTRGFSMDEDGQDSGKPAPRRVRTRQQIINGEGKRPPAAVPLTQLAHNPFNPREQLTELEETAESLTARGQVQPVAVVRRAAFLATHPGLEEQLGKAEYVVIDGNRRLAAAGLAGLAELRIDVNDDLAASAADMLEGALIANVHRVDVPPLDQAKAIQELVRVHGSQGKVAKRLGKTAAWVSQRLALLELTPELQEKVEAGELKVEPARRIGRLPKEEQAAAAAETVNAVNAPRQRSPRRVLAQRENGDTVNAVNTSRAGTEDASSASATVNGVNGEGTEPAQAQLVLPPSVTPSEVVDALVAHLSVSELTAVTELLVDRIGHEQTLVTQDSTG